MALAEQKHETFRVYIAGGGGTVPLGLLELALRSQLETKAHLMLVRINQLSKLFKYINFKA